MRDKYDIFPNFPWETDDYAPETRSKLNICDAGFAKWKDDGEYGYPKNRGRGHEWIRNDSVAYDK